MALKTDTFIGIYNIKSMDDVDFEKKLPGIPSGPGYPGGPKSKTF